MTGLLHRMATAALLTTATVPVAGTDRKEPPMTSTTTAVLSEEHEELRRTVERFAHEVVAPVIGDSTSGTSSRTTWSGRWATWACSGCRSPRSTAAWAATSSPCAWPSRSWPGSTRRSPSPWRPRSGSARCRSTASAPTSSARGGCPDLCAGRKLGAFGLTEPGGGTDAGATRTTARLDGDEWVVDGTKTFITNAGTDITALVTVTAVTGPDEISTVIVPSGTPGFTVSRPYSKVGWNASDTRELSFDGCRVPAANLLGERGRGYAQFLSILDDGRIAIAALAVGLAQGCVDESVRYARERTAFGRPIGANQAIQFTIADMEVRAHTARLAYYDAAARMLRGEPFKKQASIAKLYASEAAVDNARAATQVFGGYGFMNESPVARMWRDSKVLEIGEGTSEVQRMLIARELGL